jgi:hypothetical protein
LSSSEGGLPIGENDHGGIQQELRQAQGESHHVQPVAGVYRSFREDQHKGVKRDFYTTLYEDIVLLRAIWIFCEKPNPEIRADDARKKDAVTMVASALHMTGFLCGEVLHTRELVQVDVGAGLSRRR